MRSTVLGFRPGAARRYRLSLALVLATLAGLCLQSVPSPAWAADDFATVRARWLQMLTDAPANHADDPRYAGMLTKIAGPAEYATTIQLDEPGNEDGKLWPTDFDYTTASGVSKSFGRLQEMAKAYATPGTSISDRARLLDVTVTGLNQMITVFYNAGTTLPHPLTRSAGEWYTWEIEIPQRIVDIAVMLYGAHPELRIADYVKAIRHFTPSCLLHGQSVKERAEPFLNPTTGTNRAWKCTTQAVAGALVGDATLLTAGRDAVLELFSDVTVGDGFYADGSFIHHQRHPYTAGYGIGLMNSLTQLIFILRDTPWQLPETSRQKMLLWLREGLRPLVYRGAASDGVRGREVARSGHTGRQSGQRLGNHAAGQSLSGMALLLAEASGAQDAGELRSMAKGLMTSDSYAPYPDEYWVGLFTVARAYAVIDDAAIPANPDLTLTKVYAGMDQVTHQRPGYLFGISMFSNRTADFEGFAGENRKGWYTRFGMTQLLTPDDLGQYADEYWPTVDLTRLPGTTVSGVARDPADDGGTPSNASWVGGAVLDKRYGAVGMDLRDPYSSLTGKKSWFLYDDEIVALGAGISGSGGVVTTVDQRQVDSADTLTVDGVTRCAVNGVTEVLTGVVTAHLSGQDIGYYFPGGTTLRCRRDLRSGTWNDINALDSNTTKYERTYVTLWLDHGTDPTNAGYAYVVLPDVSGAQTAAYAAAPKVGVLRNDADAQAVQQSTLDVVGANVWRDSTQTLSAWGDSSYLTIDGAGAVVVQRTAGTVRLAVADPTQHRTGALHVKINTITNGVVSRSGNVRLLQTSPAVVSFTCLDRAGGSQMVVLATDPLVLRPVHDASTWQMYPENNYAGNELIVKTTNDSWTRRTYLKFDLSGVSVDQIGSATLRLYGRNANTKPAVDVALHNATRDDWTESDLKWSNQPDITGGPAGNITVGTTERYYSGDVTSYVREQAAGDRTVTFVLTDPAATGEYLSFSNDEAAANHPQLVLSPATPEVDTWQQPVSKVGAIADAYVDSGVPTKTGGQDWQNVVKYDSATNQRITYLSFDVSQYDSVSRATLKVYTRITTGQSSGTVNVGGVGDDWHEGTVNWNKKHDAGTLLGSVSVSSTATYVSIDVTNYVRGQLADGRASFALSADSSSPGRYVTVNSRETDTNPPELVLQNEMVSRALDDTYVDAAAPRSTFGAAQALKVNATSQVALLRYNLSPLTHVNRVAVRVFVVDCGNSSTLYAFGSADGGWSGGNTSWQTRPSPTWTLIRDIPCTSNTWNSIDVTGFAVGQWFGDVTLSVQIVGSASTSASLVSLDGTNKPEMVVLQN